VEEEISVTEYVEGKQLVDHEGNEMSLDRGLREIDRETGFDLLLD
jgi:hypothetical protein